MERIGDRGFRLLPFERTQFAIQDPSGWAEAIRRAISDIGDSGQDDRAQRSETIIFGNEDDYNAFEETAAKLEPPILVPVEGPVE